ncbi:MAG: hypothetical protein QOG04_1953 [Actinomycetota bacterium]|jgi:hypothetical protein|nr:hypothetical protein [Actinomycetota bacterium]
MEDQGVQFASVDGRRSSQHAGKAILADAVRAVDADVAGRIEKTQDWRKHYITSFTDTVVAGATSAKNASRVAVDGLNSLHDHLSFVRDGKDLRLDHAFSEAGEAVFDTEVIEGTGARATELQVPYKGALLSGDELVRQLVAWERAGVIEASARTALERVIANPDWLDLSDRYFALLGASSEMGPLSSLCAWGANVLAVDLPRRHLWEHISTLAYAGSGRVFAPVRGSGTDVVQRAGVDLITDAPAVGTWLKTFDQAFTIGNYVYADGTNFVRLATAVDALIAHLLGTRPDLSVAYLATPTDVFAVPEEVVDGARANATRSLIAGPLRALSGSKLYARNYDDLVPGEDGRRWGISDSLVPIQGPNYALAKSLQRWRAVVSREDGFVTSANVAPASNTASVTKNKMLAAAYRGAPSFGIEIFDPATTRTLMAALLVHDLRDPSAAANPATELSHPFDLFVQGAIHGGIWRLPYEARSILPIGLVGGFLKRRPPARTGF